MITKIAALGLLAMVCTLFVYCEGGSLGNQRLSGNQSVLLSSGASATGVMVKVANQPESAADKLYLHSLAKFKRLSAANEADTKSCEEDSTAVVAIYATNGLAQTGIEVVLDGSFIGSLKTYFPYEQPSCKTPSSDGVITLIVPAGQHTLKATSSNISWPGHTFSVAKCSCMLLPLS